MMEKSRAWIELDRAALRHNVEALRKRLPPGCALMPVLKANAYGHGAVTTPLRFKENIFLLYRDLISTFEVQSPHMLTRIFLAGYPPILGMVYVSRSCCLQTIKIPPNFKSEVGECLRHSKTAHRNIVFFIRWACPIYIHIKNRADEPVIAHLFIGSASYASGSLMTVI